MPLVSLAAVFSIVTREERCVTILKTAARETNMPHVSVMVALVLNAMWYTSYILTQK